MIRLTALIFLHLVTAGIYAQTAGSMAGIYNNADLQLTIELRPSSLNNLAGTIIFQGRKYSASAQYTNGMLSGNYQFDGSLVPFAIEKSGNNYTLHSEGVSLPLTWRSLPENEGNKTTTGKSNPPINNASGPRRNDPFGGYSFKVPDGWVCREEQGSFVLTLPGKTWQVAVGPHNYSDQKAGMAAAATIGVIQDEESGTYLQSSASTYTNGGIRLTLKGVANNSPLTLETLHIFSPYGGGVSLAAVMPGTADPQAIDLLADFSRQFVFDQPQKSQLVLEWESRIRGRQLVYLNTQGGGSDKTTVNLYTDGRFEYKSNSSYMSGGYSEFSYVGSNTGSGSWKIVQKGQQALLLMFYQNGGMEQYPLQQGQSGEVISNGRRYFIRSLQ